MTDEQYMDRCITLAQQGLGMVAPNPMVGSVVVHEGKIVGEGYHMQYGGPHAEVNAINSVKDQSLLYSSTLYVNLEPCAHFGKTPPCSNLIIEKKIPKVVVGCIDSYSEVAGKGIERMRNAGIEVVVGVLEKASLDLNKRFFTFHNKKRPFVILKWAQSSDGFIDIDRSTGDKGIHWITQTETKQLVHKWRREEAGILVGKNTVINDDPELTVREIEGHSPTRFIIDPANELDLTKYKVGNDKAKTVVISGQDALSIETILDRIYRENIQSVIIEGGKFTLEQFIQSGIWDEARILTGINELKNGTTAPIIQGTVVESYFYGKDKIEIYRHA
ncbi:MAG: bifunctional diaminohydroxyphosphoribosylaminopyrimidine deaminase/5-amino-6-(5-phosphoribosylamino)uracil reductase RibD [Crocinitomicaceae bacterium]|nr:bifunctional diaminohydroxyphosphoribosylaminopyrimidine deaminase/5-amino-6-(5-phosphoribosylamino)uracil reductase RibD [Crocinitomicaceae bacterium]